MDYCEFYDTKVRIYKVIYDYYETVCDLGFEYNSKIFQSTEESTNRIDKAILFAEKTYLINGVYHLPDFWIARDNSLYYFINYNDLLNFGVQMGTHWQHCFIKRTMIRDQLCAITDETELLNFNVSQRWNAIIL